MKKLEKYKMILIPGLMIVSFLMYLGSWIVSIGFRADEILESYDYWEELDDALYLYVDSVSDENAVSRIVDIFRDGKLSLRELSGLLGYMTDAPGYQGLSVLTHILVIAVPILLVASIVLFLLKKKWGAVLYFIGEVMTLVTVIAFLQKFQVEFLGISASGIISVIIALLALIACFAIPDSEAAMKGLSVKDFSVKNISLEDVKQKAASAASAAVFAAETGYGEVKEQILKYKETHDTPKATETYETPETHETPEAYETPGAYETSETRRTVETYGTSEARRTPEAYETSGNKKIQAPLFCPNCGSKLQPGAKFCSICGQPLTSIEFETVPDDYEIRSADVGTVPDDYEIRSADVGTVSGDNEIRSVDAGIVSGDYENGSGNAGTKSDSGRTIDERTPVKAASAMSDNKDMSTSKYMDASPFEGANSSTPAGTEPDETKKAAMTEEIEPAVRGGAEASMSADENPTEQEKGLSSEAEKTRTESRLNFGKRFRPDYIVPSGEEGMKNLFHRPE